MRISKSFVVVVSLLLGSVGKAEAQSSILVTDADYTAPNFFDCTPVGNGTNFYDSGNNTGNYGPNEIEEITVCPDPSGGTKLVVTIGTLSGFTWDVAGSDTLRVYDGPTTASPLLDSHNSVTDPNGFTYMSSWANQTGCLTFRFESDAALEGTGWDGKIECVSPPQPFEVHMQALINGQANGANDLINDQNPQDTGYVDVCFGDSVMFVALPDFLNDPTSGNTNGGGYDQVNSYTTTWDFSDGTQLAGDTVWFVPPARTGYLVTMRVADAFPQEEGLLAKVRVSTIPSFATCQPLDDTLCVGNFTQLIGGVTATDTAGVDPTSSGFELGGSFAGVTFLPDGNGNNYTTDIDISGFPPSAIFQNASDIQSLCIEVEHSFLGDLEAWLTCPNGTQAVLFNSSTQPGQAIPGGFNGGGVYLGQANDASSAVGVCWEYCFYDGAPNPAWAAGFPTTPVTTPSAGTAVAAGDYEPEQSFAALAGCPLNGTWTLTFRDSWAADDGWICAWGITFDPAINPNNETYTPYIVSEQWLPDPTIITGTQDTAVLVAPNQPGVYGYTFEVTDNFGCVYDTTVNLQILPGPEIMQDTVGCDAQAQIMSTVSGEGGVWAQIAGTGSTTFSPSANDDNPLLTVSDNGIYLYTYTDILCGITDTLTIVYVSDPIVNIEDQFFCEGEEYTFDVTSMVFGVSYFWNTGDTDPLLTVTDSGTYIIAVSNYCHTAIDTAIVTTDPCDLLIPNVFTPNTGDAENQFWVVPGLERYQNPYVIIYNRWGQKVYESNNYQNNWDGTNLGGNEVADGTYFYILRVIRGGQEEDFKGTVNIFRN